MIKLQKKLTLLHHQRKTNNFNRNGTYIQILEQRHQAF